MDDARARDERADTHPVVQPPAYRKPQVADYGRIEPLLNYSPPLPPKR